MTNLTSISAPIFGTAPVFNRFAIADISRIMVDFLKEFLLNQIFLLFE